MEKALRDAQVEKMALLEQQVRMNLYPKSIYKGHSREMQKWPHLTGGLHKQVLKAHGANNCPFQGHLWIMFASPMHTNLSLKATKGKRKWPHWTDGLYKQVLKVR